MRNSLRRSSGTPALHAVLHLDRAAQGVDRAAELHYRAVAGALDDAAVMGADGRVDQIAAEAPEASKGPVLVSSGEPTIADDVRDRIAASFRVSLIAPLL